MTFVYLLFCIVILCIYNCVFTFDCGNKDDYNPLLEHVCSPEFNAKSSELTEMEKLTMKPDSDISVNDELVLNKFDKNKVNYQENSKWHYHLILILWNKIKFDSKYRQKKSLNFEFKMTDEFIEDIQLYLNESRYDMSSKLNYHFLNLLSLNDQDYNKTEDVSMNHIFDLNYLIIALLIISIVCVLARWKWKGCVGLLVIAAFGQKAFDKYQTLMFKYYYNLESMPTYCHNLAALSWWQKILYSPNEECKRYYKNVLNKPNFYDVHIFEVISSLFIDLFKGFVDLSDIVGQSYNKMKNYFPWYCLPFIFLIMLYALYKAIILFGSFMCSWLSSSMKYQNDAADRSIHRKVHYIHPISSFGYRRHRRQRLQYYK